MSNWRQLLKRLVDGLSALEAAGQPVPDWVLGGGTALMIHTDHRLSKDIDAFIDNPQYITCLSPRIVDNVWHCESFDETAHYLKLAYDDGEIDFIVAATFTTIPYETRVIDDMSISIEHPVEIAIKKLHYRGSHLKVRDVFDIAVVDSFFPDLLAEQVHHVSAMKAPIQARLESITEAYVESQLAELDIRPQWQEVAATCLDRVKDIIERIPEPLPKP